MLECFQKDGSGEDPAAARATGVLEIDELSSGRVLACAECLSPVTTSAARIEVAGRHVHTRENPHGFVFTFGCFAAAPGVWAVSEPTRENTWFSGYAWQIDHCAECETHLGWLFSSADHRFHGLILDRLVAEADDAG